VIAVGRRFSRSFFGRSALAVAPDLLGHDLVRVLPDGTQLRARIVETEAYEQHDPASHAYRGRTRRNEVMFGPPGHLYVYLTYGMHHCMNVVTGEAGHACAVLLRAAEPLEGLDQMAARRGADRDRDLCSGPARWAQAFEVDRGFDGDDVVSGTRIWLEWADGIREDRIVAGPRIGVTQAADRPWRFCVSGSPWLSRPAGSAIRRSRSAAASRSSP
jgi:DNA-3-methyladenine glycosylase